MGKKRLFLSVIIVFAMIFTGACAPDGNPNTVIKDYYQHVQDGNWEAAYQLLAKETQENISREDFILYQKLLTETMKFEEFKVQKVNQVADFKVNGKKYNNVVKFTVTETNKDYYEDKEVTNSHEEYVVDDGGVWKLCKDSKLINSSIPQQYYNLAFMYFEGKGKDKNLIKAITNFKNAIEYDKDYAPAYYGLGSAYNDLERYEEAINSINLCIEKTVIKEFKSDAYNLLGIVYLNQGNYEKAKQYYNKALDIYPENEYAKNNLASLNN